MSRNVVILSALLVFPLLAEKIPLNPTPTVPAASGEVSLDKDDNGNTRIDLKIEHLARPSELAPAKLRYVVWAQAPGAPPQNLGVLKVNKDLKGEFRTVTSLQNFDIFITAENDPRAPQPQGAVVLRGTVREPTGD